MKKVGQLLSEKGYDIWAIGPEEMIEAALHLMAEKNIGALLVLDEYGLSGIFSERDYARKVFLQGKSSRTTQVQEIMTKKVYFVQTDQTIDECMALMTDKHIRHLPVFEGDTLVGVISIGDVVKAIIAEQEFLIEQLEHYITSAR